MRFSRNLSRSSGELEVNQCSSWGSWAWS